MTTMHLYEISAARDVLDAWIAESEGELTPEIEALLAELDATADEKIERVALYVRERVAQAAAVKAEIDRLTAIKRREERAAESLKAYLRREMERLGKTKMNGLLCTVAIAANPPSVRLVGDEMVFEGKPARFVRVVPARFEWDKKAMLDAWKENPAALDGIAVVDQGTSLRIR